MTREKELDWLCRLRSEIYVYMPKEWLIPMNNALDMAIKALEQEPCDDCVSREAVLDALKKCEPLIDYDEHDRRETYYEAEEVEFKISTLPPVYPQPKTGHWIPIRKSTGTIVAVKCECCGGSPRHGQKTDYCPNCGARMKSEVRNETV